MRAWLTVAVVVAWSLGCAGFEEKRRRKRDAPREQEQAADERIRARVGEFLAGAVAPVDLPVAEGVPVDVRMVDLDADHALLEVVTVPADGLADTADGGCGYPELPDWPRAGLALTLVDLASGEQRTWSVLRSDACSTATEAAAAHEAAAEAARAVGLDPDGDRPGVPRDPPIALGTALCEGAWLTDGAFAPPLDRLRAVTVSGPELQAHGFVVDGDEIRYGASRALPAGGHADFAVPEAWDSGDGWVFAVLYADRTDGCRVGIALSPPVRL